jgi:hypothetical protein
VIWGPPLSGKTTFLAALDKALADAAEADGGREGWRVRGMNPASTAALIKLTNALVSKGEFPPATTDPAAYQWALVKSESVPWWQRWFLFRPGWAEVSIPLRLIDAPGRHANPDEWADDPTAEQLIDSIVGSAGIIFIYDPTREVEEGDAYQHTYAVLAEVDHRSRLDAGKLPHFVAFCVAKFDDKRVYESAVAAQVIEYSAENGYVPFVHEDFAERFFRDMCRMPRFPGAHALLSTLMQRFRKNRIRFFVTSAIGFYVDPVTHRFNKGDFANVDGQGQVRGDVHPINVAESVSWLADKVRRK